MHRNGIAFWLRIAPVALAALLAGACNWAPLSPAGEGVRAGTVAQVASCVKLGATHAKTSTRAWVFTRNPKTIDQELEHLARNEAADMGGDTIVPQGSTSSEGRRSFDVFRCKGS